MTTIYLIRHAQAEGNIYRRCQGWYNSLITPKGYRQIDALEQRLAATHFDAVYSSDLFRTMTTAQAVCRPHGLSLHTDPRLREIGTGCWEDHTWGELLHRQRDSLLAFWRCDPAWQVEGSETFAGIQNRFHTAVEKIAQGHPGQTIAIVAHGSVIRSGLAYWLGLPPECIGQVEHGDNTSVAKLEYQDGAMGVRFYNDVSHLSPELALQYHPADTSDDGTAAAIQASSLYFRPLSLTEGGGYYLRCRENGWLASHGSMEGFSPAPFLEAAGHCLSSDPGSLLVALLGGKPAGVLQLDIQAEAGQGVGRIPFVYLEPDVRYRGLGVQLLGQAVSTYRSLGRSRLRLRCAPENEKARSFYFKHGFSKVGEEPGGIGYLDTLEKYIGYDHA